MIDASARTIITKLRGATPRERAGLALLAALLACTAAVYAMDWAATSARDATSTARRSTDSSTVLATLQDAGYRQQLQTESAKVWRWSRAGDDFAGEETMAELESLCAQAGLNDPAVELVEQAQTRGRVGAIEASITASFDWTSFLALLDAISEADLSIAVRSVDVADEEGAQRLTLVVSVPVIETGDAP